MGLWLRHTLRAEAPGHWYGDGHDRLNYFDHPRLSDSFQAELGRLCDAYKPLIMDRLRQILQSGSSALPDVRKLLS